MPKPAAKDFSPGSLAMCLVHMSLRQSSFLWRSTLQTRWKFLLHFKGHPMDIVEGAPEMSRLSAFPSSQDWYNGEVLHNHWINPACRPVSSSLKYFSSHILTGTCRKWHCTTISSCCRARSVVWRRSNIRIRTSQGIIFIHEVSRPEVLQLRTLLRGKCVHEAAFQQFGAHDISKSIYSWWTVNWI